MTKIEGTGVVSLSLDAYRALVQRAYPEPQEQTAVGTADDERTAILAWLRSAHQPMTHTCWALAKQIERGAHRS